MNINIAIIGSPHTRLRAKKTPKANIKNIITHKKTLKARKASGTHVQPLEHDSIIQVTGFMSSYLNVHNDYYLITFNNL